MKNNSWPALQSQLIFFCVSNFSQTSL